MNYLPLLIYLGLQLFYSERQAPFQSRGRVDTFTGVKIVSLMVEDTYSMTILTRDIFMNDTDDMDIHLRMIKYILWPRNGRPCMSFHPTSYSGQQTLSSRCLRGHDLMSVAVRSSIV